MLRTASVLAATVLASMLVRASPFEARASAGNEQHAAVRPAAPLSTLKSVEELRRQFTQDRGQVRLILLLSPT